MFHKCIAALLLGLTLLALVGRAADEPGVIKDAVVAEVNGEKIFVSDIQHEIASLPRNSSVDPKSPETQMALVNRLIDTKLLHQTAEKMAIAQKPEVQDLIKMAEDQIIINAMVQDKFGKELQVNDQEIKDYYDHNKTNLVAPERRRVRHLVVEQESTAIELRKKLINGSDFASLVKKYSLESWRENDGDLGYLEAQNIIPEFSEVIFKLKIKEFSTPVKTKYGYHIVQVLDIQPSSQLEFNSIKDDLKKKLLIQKHDALLANWLKELRMSANISTFGERISASSNYRMQVVSMEPANEANKKEN